MESAISAIIKRVSVRTFSSSGPGKKSIGFLKNILETSNTGPFGGRIHFKLVDTAAAGISNFERLSTYGIIRGARYYICGKVRMAPMSLVDYGYCLETVILEAAAEGLDTCWLGGTFSRSSLKNIMELEDNEVIPAITPVGYAKERASLIDRAIKIMAGSAKRLPEDELFFYEYPALPVKKEDEPDYYEVLQCVRLAPSASNLQPWRIIRDRERRAFHFYLKPKAVYNKIIKGIKLQNIDMGIAMAHFDLASGEKKLKGAWRILEGYKHYKGLQYISSWLEEQLAETSFPL